MVKVDKNGEINVDDVLFRVDPNQLYNKIMEIAEKQPNLPDGVYELLKLVDYVGGDQDSHKLKMIELSHELGTKSNEQIIDKFISGRQFERLYDFLDHNQECLSYVLEQYLKLEIALESLLYRFPILIPDVLTRFEFDLTKVDLLLKFAPESRRKYLYAVKHLPPVVQEQCNVLKLDEVKAFFIANPSLLEYVDKSVHDILTDDVISDILGSLSNSFILYTQIYQAVSRNLVGDQARFFTIWHDRAIKFIEEIDVHTYEEEREALKGLNVIMSVLADKEDLVDELKKVEFIRDFVNMTPYSLVHLCYNFRSFRDVTKTGDSLMGYLLRFDADIHMVERCQSVFGVLIDNFYLNQCAQMIRLGLVKAARTHFIDLKKNVKPIYIEDLRLYSDQVEQKDLDMTIPFLYLLDRHSVFDREQIGAVSITEPTLESYQGVKYIRDVISSQKKSSGNESEVRYYTANAVRPGTTISMLTFNGNYNDAYQRMMSMDTDKKGQINAFIHSFYYPAMCTGNIPKFTKCLLMQDMELRFTENLITRLLGFMESHSLFYGMFEIAKMANRYDEAAEAAISISHIATRNEVRVLHLGYADYYLQQAVLLRESHQQVTPRYISSTKTDTELKDKKQLVKLQLALLQICGKRKIEFDSSFDILFEKAALANAGAYFILNKDDKNKEELLQTGKVQLTQIVDRLAIVLTTLDQKEVLDFVDQYRHKDPALLKTVIPKLLQELAMEFRSELILTIISIAFTDIHIQGGLFYEFGFMYEALAPAAEDPSIIPLVAHRASELGIDVLVDQCLALLRTL